MMPPPPMPLGGIEPHRHLLRQSPAGQMTYKVMSTENFLASVTGSYLYFNRVDSYTDFASADSEDGAELPADQRINQRIGFPKAQDFTASDYYRHSRERTYACCLSAENSDFIWRTYGTGGKRGKIGILFNFDRLQDTLNRTVREAIDNDLLIYKGRLCHQIFSINYGLVEYVEREKHQEAAVVLPNPIRYAYLKDMRYAAERELRIVLSALGMGHFVLKDGSLMQFPGSFHLQFDFREVFATGAILGLECSPDCDREWVAEKLHERHIAYEWGSDRLSR